MDSKTHKHPKNSKTTEELAKYQEKCLLKDEELRKIRYEKEDAQNSLDQVNMRLSRTARDLEALQSSLQRKDSEKFDFEKQCEQMEMKLKCQMQKNQNLEKQIKILSEDRREQSKVEKQLNEKTDELSKKLAEAEELLTEKEQNFSILMAGYEELETGGGKELEEARTRIFELEQMLDVQNNSCYRSAHGTPNRGGGGDYSFNQSINNIQAQASSAANTTENMEEILLKAEVESLKKEKEKLLTEAQDHIFKIEKLDSELLMVKNTLELEQETNKKTKIELEEIETVCTNANQSVAILKNELENVKQQNSIRLKEIAEKASEHVEKFNKIRERNESIQVEMEKATVEIEKVTNDRDTLIAEKCKIEVEYEALEDQNLKLKENFEIEVNDLKRENSKSSQRIILLETEGKSLQATLKTKETSLNELTADTKQRVEKYREQIEESETALVGEKEENKRLTDELFRINGSVLSLEGQVEEVKKQRAEAMKLHEGEFDTAVRQNKILVTEVERMKEKMLKEKKEKEQTLEESDSLQKSLSSLESQYQAYKQEIENQQLKTNFHIKDLIGKNDRLNEQNDTLSQQLTSAKFDFKTIQTQLTLQKDTTEEQTIEYSNTLKNLQTIAKQSDLKASDLELQLQKSKQEQINQQNKITEFENKISQFELDINHHQQRETQLRKQNSDLNTQLDEQVASLKTLDEKFTSTQANLQASENERMMVTSENNQNTNSLTKLQRKFEVLSVQNESNKSKIKTLEQELEAACTQHDLDTSFIRSTTQKLDLTTATLTEKTTVIDQIQKSSKILHDQTTTELEELKQKLLSLEVENQEYRERESKFQEEIDTFCVEITEERGQAKKEQAALAESCQRVENEKSMLGVTFSAAEKEICFLKGEIEKFKCKEVELVEKVAELESAVEDKSRELENYTFTFDEHIKKTEVDKTLQEDTHNQTLAMLTKKRDEADEMYCNIQQLRQEKASLEDRVLEFENNEMLLNTSMLMKTDELEDLVTQKSEKVAQMEKLTRELQAKLSEEKTVYQSEIQSLQEMNNAQKEELEEELRTAIETAEREKLALATIKTRLEEQVAKMSENFSEIEVEMANYKKEAHVNFAEKDAIAKEKETISSQLTESETENIVLRDQLAALSDRLDKANANVEVLEEDLQTALTRSMNFEIVEELAKGQETELVEKEELIKNLESKFEELKAENDEKCNQVIEFSEKVAVSGKEIGKLTLSLTRKEQFLIEKQAELTKQKEILALTEAELRKVKLFVDVQKEEIIDITADHITKQGITAAINTDLNSKLTSQQAVITDFKKTSTEVQENTQFLVKKLGVLREQRDSAKQERSSAFDVIDRLTEEKSQLEERVTDQESQLALLEDKFSSILQKVQEKTQKSPAPPPRPMRNPVSTSNLREGFAANSTPQTTRRKTTTLDFQLIESSLNQSQDSIIRPSKAPTGNTQTTSSGDKFSVPNIPKRYNSQVEVASMKSYHSNTSFNSNAASVMSVGGNTSLVHDEEDKIGTGFGLLQEKLVKNQKDYYHSPNSERINELRKRNKKALPHLQSSYPIETQGRSPSKVDTTQEEDEEISSKSKILKETNGSNSSPSKKRPLSAYSDPSKTPDAKKYSKEMRSKVDTRGSIKSHSAVSMTSRNSDLENIKPAEAFVISPPANKEKKKSKGAFGKIFKTKQK